MLHIGFQWPYTVSAKKKKKKKGKEKIHQPQQARRSLSRSRDFLLGLDHLEHPVKSFRSKFSEPRRKTILAFIHR